MRVRISKFSKAYNPMVVTTWRAPEKLRNLILFIFEGGSLGPELPIFNAGGNGRQANKRAPCGDRAHDHTLTKRMLCQLS